MELTPVVLNPSYNGNLYRAAALAQLRILKEELKYSGLPSGSRKVDIAEGVTVVCSSVYGYDTVEIITDMQEVVQKDLLPQYIVLYETLDLVSSSLVVVTGTTEKDPEFTDIVCDSILTYKRILNISVITDVRCDHKHEQYRVLNVTQITDITCRAVVKNYKTKAYAVLTDIVTDTVGDGEKKRIVELTISLQGEFSVHYGTNIPVFTVILSGIIDGMLTTITVSEYDDYGISGEAYVHTTAVRGSTVGTYPLTVDVGTLVAEWFSFVGSDMQFTITRAPHPGVTLSVVPSTVRVGSTALCTLLGKVGDGLQLFDHTDTHFTVIDSTGIITGTLSTGAYYTSVYAWQAQGTNYLISNTAIFTTFKVIPAALGFYYAKYGNLPNGKVVFTGGSGRYKMIYTDPLVNGVGLQIQGDANNAIDLHVLNYSTSKCVPLGKTFVVQDYNETGNSITIDMLTWMRAAFPSIGNCSTDWWVGSWKYTWSGNELGSETLIVPASPGRVYVDQYSYNYQTGRYDYFQSWYDSYTISGNTILLKQGTYTISFITNAVHTYGNIYNSYSHATSWTYYKL